MALFTDGPASGIEDLTAHDSQLLSVASAEGIDVTTKLALAQDTVAAELAGLLRESRGPEFGLGRESSGPRLQQVVATPVVRLWHAFRTLEAVYRDAYSNQMNDRYAAKRDQFRGLGDWARDELRQAGAGIVLRPVPRATAPAAQPASGELGDGTYSVTIAWVNASGEEGAPAPPVAVAAPGGGFVVTAPRSPQGATGWNVYAGLSADAMAKQNAAPIPCEAIWAQTGAFVAGDGPSGGQAPDYHYPLPRRLQRG